MAPPKDHIAFVDLDEERQALMRHNRANNRPQLTVFVARPDMWAPMFERVKTEAAWTRPVAFVGDMGLARALVSAGRADFIATMLGAPQSEQRIDLADCNHDDWIAPLALVSVLDLFPQPWAGGDWFVGPFNFAAALPPRVRVACCSFGRASIVALEHPKLPPSFEVVAMPIGGPKERLATAAALARAGEIDLIITRSSPASSTPALPN